MNCEKKFDSSPKNKITDKCSHRTSRINKRSLLTERNTNIVACTSPKVAAKDNFASSTPLKKKRVLFTDTNKPTEICASSKSLLDDFKQSNVEGVNKSNGNKNINIKHQSHITGQSFKDIIYNCYYEDFCKPYAKLNSKILPPCCNPEICDQKHKNIKRKEITSFSNGTFFNILDNPLAGWLNDISTAAFSVLRPELYFSGDVLRILFDYILNGPEDDLMWDVKYIIASHLELHPPCTEPMRECYDTLLRKPYNQESYFQTDMVKSGVLTHIVKQLEDGHEATKYLDQEELEQSREECGNLKTRADERLPEITFEMLEQRWNNFEPLLDTEYNDVVDTIDDLEKSCQEIDELDTMKNKKLPRLAIALELVVDILEADFMICVSKLKKCISSETAKRTVPLLKYFMDENLPERVFFLYVRTNYQLLWIQLSRFISIMAEYEHLFKGFSQQLWHYPTLHSQCDRFFTSFIKHIDKCEWTEEERLMRLETLHPPWLRLQVAVHWINSDLKLAIGSDLKAVVDTIHMHIISPTKFQKDIHFKVKDIAVKNQSLEFKKKATKKNQYGETLLHRICKNKKYSKSMLFILLSSPAVNINVKDNYGWSPLHNAVLTGSTFKTKALLQYQPPPGALPIDPGAQNCQGATPLHHAVMANNLEICKLLVEYGGSCLLRKTDCQGVTPLQLAKEFSVIKCYFDRVIKTQEMLNLSPDSMLNMSEFILRLLVLACSAYMDDRHTWRVYNEMKLNPTPKPIEPKNWIIIDQDILLNSKNDQNEFRKLRKILHNLSENPKNTSLVKLWDSKFHSVFV